MQSHSQLLAGFAARLRLARVARGFTSLRALAKALDLDRERLKKWEQGVAWPRTPEAYRLCHTLGVTSDWLLFGDPKGLSADAYQLLIVSPPDISNGA
ncbi:MAG: helix-turn-helix transcriptional regulator [Geminicoccaceae bacterium]